MGWGRRVVDRFRYDGAPRVLVLALVVGGLWAWDRSNDVDLVDDVQASILASEQHDRGTIVLSPERGERWVSGEGPTNRRASVMSGFGNDDLETVFDQAVTAHEEKLSSTFSVGTSAETCRYWPVPGSERRWDHLLRLCWADGRPGSRPISSTQLALTID